MEPFLTNIHKKRRQTSGEKWNKTDDFMCHVCGYDCSRSFYQNSHSCCSLYPSIFVYHVSRAFVRRKAWRSCGRCLHTAWTGRASHLCPGRRHWLCVSAKFWVYPRFCRRGLYYRGDCQSKSKSFLSPSACC